MRLFLATAVAALIATPAAADTFVDYTDSQPTLSGFGFLSDEDANWAASWTQDVATYNTAISAVLYSNVGVASANWYVTTAIGAGTTAADVVASGTYTVADHDFGEMADLATAPTTSIAEGLDLSAGTYFLVLDGAPGGFVNNYSWIGDPYTTVAGTGGFHVNGYSFAGGAFGGPRPDAFAPASPFVPGDADFNLAFRITGDLTASVPEPASWAMMIAGFGLVGGALRRAPRREKLAA